MLFEKSQKVNKGPFSIIAYELPMLLIFLFFINGEVNLDAGQSAQQKIVEDLKQNPDNKEFGFFRGCDLVYLAEIEEKRKYKNVPPIIDSSITFQLWKEFFNYPAKSNCNRNISDREKEMMKEKMLPKHRKQ